MNKHEYICTLTNVVAAKSTCDRAKTGAVFVNDDFEIIATGYNGPPKGFKHCDEVGHLMENGHCVRTVHAEQNAIVQAAKRGTPLKGSILYTTTSPCFICAKMLINLNVKQIMIKKFYRDQKACDWLKQAGITVKTWKEVLI